MNVGGLAKLRHVVRHRPRRVAAGFLLCAVLLSVLLVVQTRNTETHGRRCAAAGAVSMPRRAVNDAELSQRQLRCADLERSTVDGFVREANLSGSNLHEANLRTVSMENVDLTGADLTGADVRDATLTGVELGRADLRRTTWNGSTFADTGLRGAVLRDAHLRQTEFRRSDFGGADVRGADLSGALLADTDLRGARLDDADLDDVTWVNVVCPDGTKSGGDRRESCAGHLTPK